MDPAGLIMTMVRSIPLFKKLDLLSVENQKSVCRSFQPTQEVCRTSNKKSDVKLPNSRRSYILLSYCDSNVYLIETITAFLILDL